MSEDAFTFIIPQTGARESTTECIGGVARVWRKHVNAIYGSGLFHFLHPYACDLSHGLPGPEFPSKKVGVLFEHRKGERFLRGSHERGPSRILFIKRGDRF